MMRTLAEVTLTVTSDGGMPAKVANLSPIALTAASVYIVTSPEARRVVVIVGRSEWTSGVDGEAVQVAM